MATPKGLLSFMYNVLYASNPSGFMSYSEETMQEYDLGEPIKQAIRRSGYRDQCTENDMRDIYYYMIPEIKQIYVDIISKSPRQGANGILSNENFPQTFLSFLYKVKYEKSVRDKLGSDFLGAMKDFGLDTNATALQLIKKDEA